MRLALTITVAAAGAFLFGLAFLLVPTSLLSLYGVTLDPSSEYLARYFGSALLGLAAVNWIGRSLKSGPGLRAILVGGLVATITGLAVSIFELLRGVDNMFIWSTLVIYLLLSLGFGDFVFRTPPPR
jgi:hypothetical protein